MASATSKIRHPRQRENRAANKKTCVVILGAVSICRSGPKGPGKQRDMGNDSSLFIKRRKSVYASSACQTEQ
jgi:hypothetical protein